MLSGLRFFESSDFTKTLVDYLPVGSLNNFLIVGDFMCGDGPYWPELIDFFNKSFNDYKLFAYDSDERLFDYKPLVGVNFLNSNVLSVKQSFDLITTFRPNCGAVHKIERLLPVYRHIYDLLSTDGLLFATTYWKHEMKFLSKALKYYSDFTDITVKRNKNDPNELEHGWVLTAFK